MVRKIYHRPRDLAARIAELEQAAGRGAASFADLQELANLEARRIRRLQERAYL